MKIQKIVRYITFGMFIFLYTLLPFKSFAATDSYSLDLTWDQAICTGYFSADGYTGLNESVKNTFEVNEGDTVNLTIVNQSSTNLVYSLSSGSYTTGDIPIAANATVTASYPNLQSNLLVQGTVDPFSNICGYKTDSAEVTFVPITPSPPVPSAPVDTSSSPKASSSTSTTPTTTPTTTSPAPSSTLTITKPIASSSMNKISPIVSNTKVYKSIKPSTGIYTIYTLIFLIISALVSLASWMYINKPFKRINRKTFGFINMFSK